MKVNIPEDYIDFLWWVKETTESFWSENPQTSNADFVCSEWVLGAKWIGMEESEIKNIEKKFNIKFTNSHKQFLKILHTIDKKEIREYTESFDEDAEVKFEEIPFFYNWKKDIEEINYRLEWPYRTIFEDVIGQNKVWLKSWGKIRPKSNLKKGEIFKNWFKNVPKLIPITGHRFVVSENLKKDNPVLSVYGSDIIVYGWNMRHYLLNELKEHLNLFEFVYDNEDEQYYSEVKKELQDIHNYEYGKAKTKTIPVIEEMIMYWSSGWSSFGKQYPKEDGNILQPIVKTFIPDDEDLDSYTKKFNSY